MWETWLTKHDLMLRRTARKFGGGFWGDDLYQDLLIKLWRAAEKYGGDFPYVASRCIKNVVIEHLRFLKRNQFLSLNTEIDIACEEALRYDWQGLFEIGHHTGNMAGVRFMRSVLNPDQNQLRNEEEAGGFRWKIVLKTVGLSKNEMHQSFAQLKYDAIKASETDEPFYLEGA
jgi:DNA-directed RNA polymerase specialized sigma24 family protein